MCHVGILSSIFFLFFILNQKKGRGRQRSWSAPPVLRRLKKRKRSSEVSMKAVLSSLKSGVSVLQTAQEHGAPRTNAQR